MIFTALLLMFFLGTISSEEHGEVPQTDHDEKVTSSLIGPQCDMPDELETSPLSDCAVKETPNFTITEMTLEQNCPSGDMSCHYRFFNCKRTFACAQHTCRCYRGNLSSFHSQQNNNYVSQFVRHKSLNTSFVWIGVYKPRKSCHYRNVDGSCMNYSNWAPGQPKGRGGRCIALNVKNGKWYAAHCCARLPFICTF
uniref:C-type lectin domain-containing protein n=1 Tax=Leptobrachium leishanense TaxID=445787 RepID=A0A8C5Q7Y9_9ANUR